jgi:hypothetical protein
MNFATSSILPAARGEIGVKKDKNNNYVIDVRVQNLAEANRLNPPKETYIVWMESNRNSAKKLGQIRPTSKALTGKLTATETTQPDDIFITAEDNADVSYPNGQVVLTTKR